MDGAEAIVALIGFGEAGAAFAQRGALPLARIRAYDRQTDAAATAAAKRGDYARTGVTGCASAAAALAGARIVVSLVTADQALAAARGAAPHLAGDALWLDLNSVAPETKRAACAAIERAGARYVDVAVMAPVHPAGLAVPLLVSGAHAAAGAAALAALGFSRVRGVPGGIGAASAIKMIRSVMVKGSEALTAECVLAAAAAGVTDEVLASLDAGPAPAGWSARADYALDRMLVHGLRRAAELEEVAATLDALGTGSAMTRAAIGRQRALGALGLAPPAGLALKVAAILAAAPPPDDEAQAA